MEIGAHISRSTAPEAVKELAINTFQVFIGSTRRWYVSPISDKESNVLNKLSLPIFVHSPYLINPASANPAVRDNSLKALQRQLDNCASIGAKGLVVHAGQGGAGSTMEEAIDRWQEVLKEITFTSRIIIENTAGGSVAPGRGISDFVKLLEALDDYPIDYCIDTCHSWAGNFGLDNLYTRLLTEVGRGPAVVHMNASRDAEASGRDRHANLTAGEKMTELSIEFAKEANVPVILETPNEGFLADLELLRDRLL